MGAYKPTFTSLEKRLVLFACWLHFWMFPGQVVAGVEGIRWYPKNIGIAKLVPITSITTVTIVIIIITFIIIINIITIHYYCIHFSFIIITVVIIWWRFGGYIVFMGFINQPIAGGAGHVMSSPMSNPGHDRIVT